MKTCTKCKISKPKSEFSEQSKITGTDKVSTRDGLRVYCQSCRKAYAKEYYQNNKAKSFVTSREWRLANPEKRAVICKAWRQANPEACAAYQRAWSLAHPERHPAYKLVYNAVKNGILTRLPCEICGTEENVHGHHEDCSKSLDVNWLCQEHHSERHAEIKAAYDNNPPDRYGLGLNERRSL